MELCVGRSLAVHSFGKTEIGWSSVSRIMINEVFRAQFYVIGALFSLGKLQRVNNESLFDDTNFVT